MQLQILASSSKTYFLTQNEYLLKFKSNLFFYAEVLVAEKCVWFILALAVWCNLLRKCNLR